MDSPNSLGCCPSCPNGISDTLRPLPSEWTYPNVAGKPIPCFRDAVMLKSACPCLRRNQRQIAPVADLRILFLAARVYARVRIPPKALGRPMSSCFRLALNPVAWDGSRLGGMPIENETPEQRLERRRQQSNNAISWLDSHWTQPRTCPVCGGNQWSVAQTFDLREFEGGSIIIGLGSEVLPVTPISCKSCGYLFFMDASVAGSAIPPKSMTESADD